MITDNFSFTDIVTNLKQGINFDFSRWGDGEFNCLFQDSRSRMNCDKHTYFPDMGKRLLSVLESKPDYHIGLQGLAYRQRPEQIDKLTKENNLTWCANDIIHKANIKGYINELFDVLKERKVILVGGEHLSKFNEFEFEHIVIPSKDCWLSYKEIKRNIAERIYPDVVVLYCASMMAKVLIDDFKGQATQICIGSALDVWVGVNSRSYHKVLSEKINK